MEDKYAEIYDLFENSVSSFLEDRLNIARNYLGQMVDVVREMYKKGQIESAKSLPLEGLQTYGLDEEGIMGLQQKVSEEYFPELNTNFLPLRFDYEEQAERFCIPGKYLSLPQDIFEKLASYFFNQAIRSDQDYSC